MTKALPKYESPPVVETVLSVQFDPLKQYTSAHSGWFWKNYLDETWITSQDAPRLQDQFERFGDERIWTPRGARFSLRPGVEPERIQFIHKNDERMIQIQGSKFIYNWRKRKSHYPSYDKLLPEFNIQFEKFKQFAEDSGNEKLQLNQWEVTYVNHFFKGELWETSSDLSSILPSLSIPPAMPDKQQLDRFNGEWHFIIGENLGRLYITIDQVRVLEEEEEEKDALLLQFTARGPITAENVDNLKSCFDIGHESIVQSFTDITSKSAHKFWKRTD